MGGTYEQAMVNDYDRRFYKSVDLNDFPKGSIEENFSILRMAKAMNAYRNGDAYAWQRYAPWEKAYYDAVTKAQAESNGQDGGFLAPETWINQLYGVLRPASVLEKLPITRMSVSTRVQHIPRVTGDITIGYTAENGALTASQFQFSQNTLTPRKQSAFIQVSNELMRDSLPDAENAIRTEAALAIARDRDKQALLGNGQGGVPVGLINITNVTSTSLAATPTYANLHSGILNVENLNTSANVPTGEAVCSGIVGAVQLKHTIYKLTDSSVGRPIMFQWGISPVGNTGPAGPVGGDGGLNGFLGVPVWAFTNLLPIGNSGDIFYGDWRWFILAERQDVEVMASNVAGTAFQNDQTWIRLIYRYDVTCMHPEAFFVHTNAQP
jgi:HK97 family phage major capsid protein